MCKIPCWPLKKLPSWPSCFRKWGKFQGQISGGYRGYLYLLKIWTIKTFNFHRWGKASECMTIKKHLWWPTCFSKLGQNYFQATFCNDKHILLKINRKISTHCFMTDKETLVTAILFFQNEVKNIPRQDFVLLNISCKFENSTYNTFTSGGVTGKSLHTVVAAV